MKTAPFGYLRLRRATYTEEELASWRAKIDAAGWDDCFVFFKHEDGPTGPEMADRFQSI